MHKIEVSSARSLVGSEIALTDWFVVDQSKIDAFAEVTGDHQWIHVDVARSEEAMGGTIAHGFLLLSILPAMLGTEVEFVGCEAGFNYGVEGLRFVSPVKAGESIRARQTLIAYEDRPSGKLLRSKVSVEVAGKDKPALVVETMALFR